MLAAPELEHAGARHRGVARLASLIDRPLLGTLDQKIEPAHTALIELRGTTSPRLVLELLCARMQLPDATTDSAALLQRVERLERRLAASQSGTPTEPNAYLFGRLTNDAADDSVRP